MTGDGSWGLSRWGPPPKYPPWDITLSAFLLSGRKCPANEVPCMPSTAYLYRAMERVAVTGEAAREPLHRRVVGKPKTWVYVMTSAKPFVWPAARSFIRGRESKAAILSGMV